MNQKPPCSRLPSYEDLSEFAQSESKSDSSLDDSELSSTASTATCDKKVENKLCTSISSKACDTEGRPPGKYAGDLYINDNESVSQSIANIRLAEATAKQRDAPPTVWIIVITAALTYTLHGFSNSVTNGIITNVSFLKQFPEIDTVDTSGAMKTEDSTMQGVTVGMYQVGCALGALACYYLNDRIGRKRVIHLLGFLNCVGILLQVSAFTLPHLIIGRIVTGLGVGAGHATFPLYLAECVTSKIRGRAIIICAAAGNFGHFIGAAIEVGFYFVKGTAQWRTPVGLEMIWGIGSAVMPFWCPESPRFLLRKGRYEACIEAQSRLMGLDSEDETVLEEIKVLEEALHESGADEVERRIKPPRCYYRVLLAVFIQVMSSMSGIDVVSFFSTQTFQSQLHFSPLMSRYLTMGLQACQCLFSTIAIFLIDSLGRRPLVMTCAGMMAVSMGFLFGLTLPSATTSMLKAAILFYFFTMCAYPVGYHLVPAMIAAELSPGAWRHKICAFTGCLHFLFDFTVTLITPVAFNSIHSRYYLVYTVTNAVTLLVVYFYFLETKGLELEAIDQIFHEAPNYLAIVKYADKIRDSESKIKKVKTDLT